uniref:hypothetical protein n=1 Tax=Candidatus Electronema sp. TaxID=2698783 RepID=UPI004055A22F
MLYVKEVNKKGFSGTHWNDQDSKSYPASVPFSFMNDVSIEIRRYIGFWHFKYSSILKCIFHDWTCINRIPLVRDKIDQFFFNRRDVALKERIKTLQILVKKHLDGKSCSFSLEEFLIILHGSESRWMSHPDGMKIYHGAELLLESLKESGELQGGNDHYELTGKALITLETYEREAIRHEQMLSQSRHMKWLTFALIIVGIIQALVAYFHK